MNNIEERINKIEEKLGFGNVSGTALNRVFDIGGQFCWCLSLGHMSFPKLFINGLTIDECLDKAEKFLNICFNDKKWVKEWNVNKNYMFNGIQIDLKTKF